MNADGYNLDDAMLWFPPLFSIISQFFARIREKTLKNVMMRKWRKYAKGEGLWNGLDWSETLHEMQQSPKKKKSI